jgi:hypothetical protein
VITPALFDKLVKEEIELQLKLHYLTDTRLLRVFKETSMQKLKDVHKFRQTNRELALRLSYSIKRYNDWE